MNRSSAPPIEYSQDYFFESYKNQYGKTYLDDFPHLQKNGERRLHLINTLPDLKRNAPIVPADGMKHRLLDIGCAYGPFLAAAKNQGFEATGIDPAADAVDYVRKTLGINAVQGTFFESLPELKKAHGTGKDRDLYDVITLWYVLEHFEEPGKALTAINGLLVTGGILAFSTPSAAGISRRKSLYSFLEHSPADHWTIWDPRRTAAILKRYGFRLKKLIITGHHPERFPPLPFGMKFPLALSRIFGMGDTFEVYAVKTRELQGGKNG
jgi:2-polyprenyl-3-methyl-5-hydroxy-6-metoxy-1,4-benzoquinol methylase